MDTHKNEAILLPPSKDFILTNPSINTAIRRLEILSKMFGFNIFDYLYRFKDDRNIVGVLVGGSAIYSPAPYLRMVSDIDVVLVTDGYTPWISCLNNHIPKGLQILYTDIDRRPLPFIRRLISAESVVFSGKEFFLKNRGDLTVDELLYLILRDVGNKLSSKGYIVPRTHGEEDFPYLLDMAQNFLSDPKKEKDFLSVWQLSVWKRRIKKPHLLMFGLKKKLLKKTIEKC